MKRELFVLIIGVFYCCSLLAQETQHSVGFYDVCCCQDSNSEYNPSLYDKGVASSNWNGEDSQQSLGTVYSEVEMIPIDMRKEFDISVAESKREFLPLLAVKTNLLYWIGIMPDFRRYTFVPNLEIEWFAGKGWSLAGAGNYAKWKYGSHNFFGISSWNLEPRKWFCIDGKYQGVYLGIYAQVGDYDYQHERLERDGITGKLWGTGLSIGIVLPFSDRWGVEIGIRGGYRCSTVRNYSHEHSNYYFDYEFKEHHWEVTGIKTSLYFRLGKSSK